MKYLNKNFRASPLNKKVRWWYQLKQNANNTIKDEQIKSDVMKYCDRQINLCWYRSYHGAAGYEMTNSESVADTAVHGRWIICSDGYYPYCSECKEEPSSGEMTNYCPCCGAKMDMR